MKIKGLSTTVIFEASAVNRDEKLAGNIASIKKLSRSDGTYSFMSRAFVRHKLFETLQVLYGWEAAPVAVVRGQQGQSVIQFRFPDANIITYPEMDVFGFMNTSILDSETGIVRKAPLGMTKAISLEAWQADMAFYANHDMVRRALAGGLEATPNPFQKEEHHSLYKISFTIDLQRLGCHEVYFKEMPGALKDWLEKLPKASPSSIDEFKKFYGNKLGDDADWRQIVCGDSFGLVGEMKEGGASKLVFFAHPGERKKRINQLLNVITSGLMMHSSTENYGIVPVFFIVGSLRVPVPVFNSYVMLKNGTVDAGVLNNALRNFYVDRAWYSAGSIPLSGQLDEKVQPWQGVDEVLKATGQQ